MTPEQVVEMKQKDDRLALLDLRPESEFNQSHMSGAINAPFKEEEYDLAVKKVISQDKSLVLVYEDPQQLTQASQILTDAHFDVKGAMDWKDWADGGYPTVSLESIASHEVRNRLQEGKLVLIDVRNPDEWEHAHLPNSINIPLLELEKELAKLSPDQEIVTICGIGGGRSAAAFSVLEGKGFKMVKLLQGGLNAWREAGFEVEE